MNKFALVLFYDILVYSKDRAAHEKHLLTVFSILSEKKLHINAGKCHIRKEGYKILDIGSLHKGLPLTMTRFKCLSPGLHLAISIAFEASWV